MNSLSKILLQLPNLDITKEEHDIQKLEIEFRANSEEWLRILQNITMSLPNVYFCKRYFSEGGSFGFRWVIIVFGITEEHIDELAQRFQFLLFEKQFSERKKDLPKKPIAKKVVVTTTKLEKGEETNFPIPHIEEEMNKPTEKGRGAYTKATDLSNKLGLGKGSVG